MVLCSWYILYRILNARNDRSCLWVNRGFVASPWQQSRHNGKPGLRADRDSPLSLSLQPLLQLQTAQLLLLLYYRNCTSTCAPTLIRLSSLRNREVCFLCVTTELTKDAPSLPLLPLCTFRAARPRFFESGQCGELGLSPYTRK